MSDVGASPATQPLPTRRELRTGSIAVQKPVHTPSPFPKLLALVIALVGGALVAIGVLAGTVFAPAPTLSAKLSTSTDGKPVIVGDQGLLGLEGTRVRVTATGAAGKPVFLGIGRAADIDAYVGDAARLQVDGQDGDGALTTKAAGKAASLPDPAAVDVWVLSQRGRGTAAVDWPAVTGPWVVVAASDGKAAAPAQVEFTWSGRSEHSSGPVLIAVGAVLLVCGAVLYVMLRSRAKLEGGRS